MAKARGTRVRGAVGAGTVLVLALASCSTADGSPPDWGLPGDILIVFLMSTGMIMALAFTCLAGWAVVAAVVGLRRLVLGEPQPAPSWSFSLRSEARPEGRTGISAPAPPGRAGDWSRARERFHRVRAEYAAYECDPVLVLQLPALADVSVASTARFVEAFAEAQGLETGAQPEPEHARLFTEAVERAARSWTAALDAAERIRSSGLGPAERRAVERVVELLTTARDSDSEPERLAAYARARSELAELDRAGVLHLPRLARVALDTAGRGQLLPVPEAVQHRPG